MKNNKHKMQYVNTHENVVIPTSLMLIFLCIVIISLMVQSVKISEKQKTINILKSFAPSGYSRCALTSDGACSMFFDCEYGYGTMEDLNCHCTGEWKTFNWYDLNEIS